MNGVGNTDTVIFASGLGKKYRIGHRSSNGHYVALRDVLATSVKNIWGRTSDLLCGRPLIQGDTFEEIWALRDLALEVKQGEVLAVIGSNGAGKSTLLKILSRITEPTEGEVGIRGRVASLMEVGTGFHPELSGRENVFLNGAVLGMTRVEIRRKFDEIVAFAEIEQFIDTPVKRYSSGMQVRLAFAVAAHLEAEILLIDEILAVGDAQFQRKCLGKMSDVARGGRTVLFVSHNMAAVRALCTRAVLLKGGRLVDTADLNDAIQHYQEPVHTKERWRRDVARRTGRRLVFSRLECELTGKQPNLTLVIDGDLESVDRHPDAFLAFDVVDVTSVPVFQAVPTQEPFIAYSESRTHFRVEIELPPMVPGPYQVHAWAGSHYNQTLDMVESAIEFRIDTSPTVGRTYPHTPDHGFIVPRSHVTVCENSVGRQPGGLAAC